MPDGISNPITEKPSAPSPVKSTTGEPGEGELAPIA